MVEYDKIWLPYCNDAEKEHVMFLLCNSMFVLNILISYIPSFLFWGKLYCSDEIK